MSQKPPQELVNLVKELDANGIKVYAKKDGPDLLLWCNFASKVKQKPGDGLEVWGRSQKITENISAAVFKYFQHAEITSQAGNGQIIFRLNN